MRFGHSLRALALFVLAGAAAPAWPWPFAAHPARIGVERARLGDWQLEIARNAFSGAVACRLRAADHKAVYRAGAVGFRFDPHWNVGQAVYRLDGGAPRAARDDLPDLVARGVPLDRGGMDNASGGVVWVAYARLAGANSIAIAARPDRGPVLFHFRGLVALHNIAVARGCTPDGSFVER